MSWKLRNLGDTGSGITTVMTNSKIHTSKMPSSNWSTSTKLFIKIFKTPTSDKVCCREKKDRTRSSSQLLRLSNRWRLTTMHWSQRTWEDLLSSGTSRTLWMSSTNSDQLQTLRRATLTAGSNVLMNQWQLLESISESTTKDNGTSWCEESLTFSTESQTKTPSRRCMTLKRSDLHKNCSINHLCSVALLLLNVRDVLIFFLRVGLVSFWLLLTIEGMLIERSFFSWLGENGET